MGNGYNHHHHHHHHLHNNHLLHKSTFLPILCSKSLIKDVAAVSKYGDHHRSFSTDPLSPRVGCMGQVKRHNNRIMGFPTSTTMSITTTSCKFTTTTTTTTSKFNNNNTKYFKLKKLFSSKNLITPTTTITAAAAAATTSISSTSTSTSSSSNCGSGKQAVMDNNCHFGFNDISSDPPINVADLDPPLPVVIKKVQKREDSSGDDADNLWRRRRKLRNLQIQQIQIPNQCLQPTSIGIVR